MKSLNIISSRFHELNPDLFLSQKATYGNQSFHNSFQHDAQIITKMS